MKLSVPGIIRQASASLRREEDTPNWEHDCPDCEYLGAVIANSTEHADERPQLLDVYVCGFPKRGNLSNLVARHGPQPRDFASMPLVYSLHSSNLGLHYGRLILEARAFWVAHALALCSP